MGTAVTRTTCRDVAMVLASEGAADPAAAERCAQHLASCQKCVTFERQLAFIDEAVRCSCLGFEQELPEDFEARLVRRLCS